MIYNSYDYDYAFSSVDQIVFTLGETPSWYKDGDLSNAHITNLPFNTDYVNLDQKFMRAGGSALASFNTMKVTEIKITVSQKFKGDVDAIKISDIVVLGR